jgi:PAS domain-containing protein
MQYCNHRFFEVTGLPIAPIHEVDWTAFILPEDLHIVEEAWRVLLEENQPISIEYRIKRTYESSDGVRSQAWILAKAVPDVNSEGVVTGVMGSMTDISQFKWAESVQRIRMDELLESKRQQEK